eukprot:jgi/Chlat1/291/Chrsp1S03163
MSSVYTLEPPTKGKVVMATTMGDIDIELWAKECPKACRNFVQLALEGYYDGVSFHRVLPNFLIQGGDPTGTGKGGDTIYGAPFTDEVHTRLRFTHRGIVACANAGTPNTNNAQFFITLDKCDWLDKKHTIFGKVTGDTIYNVTSIGELETDADDRPLEPPIIKSIDVIWNPFDDMVPREGYWANLRKAAEDKVEEQVVKVNRKKEKKNLSLLSFGEEAQEEEEFVTAKKSKIRASHDVLNDPRLVAEVPAEQREQEEQEKTRRQALKESVKRALTATREDDAEDNDAEDEGGFDAMMRKQLMEKRQKLSEAGKIQAEKKRPVARDAPRRRADTDEDEDEDTDGKEKRERKEPLRLKQTGRGAKGAEMDNLLTPAEQMRLKYKQNKKSRAEREAQTLERLNKFAGSLKAKSVNESAAVTTTKKDDEDENDDAWRTHNLKFAKDASRKDDMARNDDVGQYVVLDPLLEKGKSKFNKQDALRMKRNSEWAIKAQKPVD